MFDSAGSTNLGDVQVYTSDNSGHSPEQMAEMAVNKIMLVSKDAPPVIREQALQFRVSYKRAIGLLYEKNGSE